MPSLTKRSLPVVVAAPGASGTRTESLWRSLQEKLRGPDREAARAEFAAGATDADAPVAPFVGEADGTSRRGFLQLLSGTMALAGLTGCVQRPKEQALPYTRQPENVVPGKALHYATLSALGGYATGLLVTANDGRPTKIEGNPEHPDSLGASGLLQQASILSLYDPQRAGVVKFRGAPRAWKGFMEAQARHLAELKVRDGGAGVRFLMEPSASPLLARLRERVLAELPKARFQALSPLPVEAAATGARIAFGEPLEARIDLTGVRVVASLDADLLSSAPGTLRHMRAFAAGRDPKAGPLSRWYQIESQLTVTGASADHRLPVRPSEVPRIAAALLAQVAKLRGGALAKAAAGIAIPLGAEQRKLVDALARDLVAHAGHGAVIAGARQPAQVHAIAFGLNAALGNTAVRAAPGALLDEADGPAALARLAAEMRKGQIDTLVITARNPLYAAPADLEFQQALRQVPNVVYLSPYEDETSAAATWFVPAAHELEAWGDGRAQDGTVTFQQPLVQPLFNGHTEAELLAALLGEGEKGAYTLLREFWQTQPQAAAHFDVAWDRWVSRGLLEKSAAPASTAPAPAWAAIAAAALQAAPAAAAGTLEVDFALDAKVWDGRFANNSWLQELPDPITRLSWDNAALLSPATAQRLGVVTGELVELTLRGRTLRAPVLVQPGQAAETVTLPLGYGRSSYGETLCAGVGFNANSLRNSAGYFSDVGVELKKVPGKHHLVQTQEHHSMDDGVSEKPRFIAASLTLEQFEKEGEEILGEHRGAQETVHTPVEYDGFKWAMAIDLGKCTGCNACVVACQSENNIPVVGKENVGKSREMHWLRIDRYFRGDEQNPEVIPQPMLCQHCESAPCEYVCPVNATVHDDEGLNVMVYNRCVGTRYCSNNCPYKVRRFNFFNYTAQYTTVERMSQNPDVTVRARGVMEKCTFCVQRIERGRIEARVAGKVLQDGEIVSACAQACPAQAITFGSLHDASWKVSEKHKDPRRYDTLHELGTRPRVGYLARVKNPNPELA